MVIERLDVCGYVERGETTKDYRITITGFFPPTEVSSEHDATLYGFDDEGIGHVIEDNTSILTPKKRTPFTRIKGSGRFK